MRGARRKRSREEAIYGSFLEDMTEVGGRGRGGDDDDDDAYGGRGGLGSSRGLSLIHI